jgi:hypothetical protein
MKFVVPTVLFVALGVFGCAGEDDSPEGVIVDSIEGTQAVHEARDYWETAHPDLDVSDCKAPGWSHVTLEQFKYYCGAPSCAAPDADARSCNIACTTWFHGQPFSAYAGPSRAGIEDIAENVAQAHETMHVFEWCSTGGADGEHTDSKVWGTAMHWVTVRLAPPEQGQQ